MVSNINALGVTRCIIVVSFQVALIRKRKPIIANAIEIAMDNWIGDLALSPSSIPLTKVYFASTSKNATIKYKVISVIPLI